MTDKESLDRIQEERDQAAKILREEANRAETLEEVRQRVRACLKEESHDDLGNRFYQSLKDGTVDEINSAFVDLKRTIEIEHKSRKISSKTYEYAESIFHLVQNFLDAKSKVETDSKKMTRLREFKDLPLPKEKAELRDAILHYRHSLQSYELLSKQIGKLVDLFSQKRNSEIAEEQTLKSLSEYYLRNVDPAQRARLEVLIERKIKGLPYERRIPAVKKFIETLLRSSPSILHAEVERLLELSSHFLEQNHFESAIANAQKALDYMPQSPRGFLQLARCLQRKGEREQAIQILYQAAELNRLDMEIQLRLAQLYEEVANYPAAIFRYQIVQKSKPDSFSLTSHLAYLAFTHGYWKIAIPLLEALRIQNPQSFKIAKRLGIALIRNKQSEKGIALVKSTLAKNPQDPDLHSVLGEAYRAQGWYKDAFFEYQMAIELDPSSINNQKAWIQIHLDTGNYIKAEELCRELLHQAKERKKEILVLYAEILRKNKKYGEAVNLLQPLIDNRIQEHAIRLEYSLSALDAGKEEQAYAVLGSLIQESNEAPIRLAFSQACIRTGRFAQAMPYLTPG